MAKQQEWKVYYSGNFWGHDKGERRCREIVIEKSFEWEEQKWRIPSIYICPKGLVIDFCVEVPAKEVRDFIKRWYLQSEVGHDYTDEEYQQIEADNPLGLHIRPTAYVNGKKLKTDHGSSVSWNPCLTDGMSGEMEAREALEYYRCDPAKGWIFMRYAFRWETRNRAIHEIKLTLKQDPMSVAGPHFCTESGDECFEFIHPVTAKKHRLTVTAFEQGELPDNPLSDHYREWKNMEWPRKYMQMQYTLDPDLSNQEVSVVDCVRCDQPREKVSGEIVGGIGAAASVSVIGGADGPVSVFVCGKSAKSTHLACSSPRFEWVDKVEWRMIFNQTARKEKEIWVVKEEPA